MKAVVPKGKLQGTHIGRVTTRVKPNFCVGEIDGIHPKHITLLQRNNGYAYAYAKTTTAEQLIASCRAELNGY